MTRPFWGVLVAATAATVLAAGCGGHDSGGDPMGSGLPRDAAVGNLTPTEGMQLCDWTNRLQGGYGKSAQCPDGGVVGTNADQEECLRGLPDVLFACPALTVADVEDCTKAQGTDLCRYNWDLACAPLRACSTAE